MSLLHVTQHSVTSKDKINMTPYAWREGFAVSVYSDWIGARERVGHHCVTVRFVDLLEMTKLWTLCACCISGLRSVRFGKI